MACQDVGSFPEYTKAVFKWAMPPIPTQKLHQHMTDNKEAQTLTEATLIIEP